MKSSNDAIVIRTRDLLTCIAVPATLRHKIIVNCKNIPVHVAVQYRYIQRSAAVRRQSNGACCELSSAAVGLARR